MKISLLSAGAAAVLAISGCKHTRQTVPVDPVPPPPITTSRTPAPTAPESTADQPAPGDFSNARTGDQWRTGRAQTEGGPRVPPGSERQTREAERSGANAGTTPPAPAPSTTNAGTPPPPGGATRTSPPTGGTAEAGATPTPPPARTQTPAQDAQPGGTGTTTARDTVAIERDAEDDDGRVKHKGKKPKDCEPGKGKKVGKKHKREACPEDRKD